MSGLMEGMLKRRSIRAYKPDMVPQEAIEAILKAGTYAPTGSGKQSPIIIAVTNQAMRDKLSAMNAKVMGKEGDDPFYGALWCWWCWRISPNPPICTMAAW